MWIWPDPPTSPFEPASPAIPAVEVESSIKRGKKKKEKKLRISLGGLVSSTTHHQNHEQLHCFQETDSLRLKVLHDYTQQIASHLSDPDYDLYMEYNTDSLYLYAL